MQEMNPKDRNNVPDEQAGEPACLLERVCPACGALAEAQHPTVCQRCGADEFAE